MSWSSFGISRWNTRTYFSAVEKSPFLFLIVQVQAATISVRRAISTEGRSLKSQVQTSTPAATERGENARIGIETR
jgi:hypothetical protein